jgi:nicotinamidase-related amidase
LALKAEVPEYVVHEEVYVDPASTALVVIDMQNDLVKQGGSLVVPEAEATVPAIKSLLHLARGGGMRIVYSQDTHREGDPEWEVWPEHCRDGSWGWEIVTELAPGAEDTVLSKLRYDAFHGTPLDHLLQLWGIDTLVICGTVANISVHYTAASAALRWYAVVIPRDAISALDPFDLESSLRQTALVLGGQMTTASGVRMLGRARTARPDASASPLSHRRIPPAQRVYQAGDYLPQTLGPRAAERLKPRRSRKDPPARLGQ